MTACSSSGSSPSPGVDSGSGPVDDASVPEVAPAPNPLAEGVDALFAAAEASDTFSGTVVVVDDGKTVLEKSYGTMDRSTERKGAPDSILRVGSISKQFTASAVLALAAEGKLALTDPVSKYFPGYPPANLELDGVAVTLHHLLSHTSGLPDPRATEGFKKIVWRREIAPTEQIDLIKGSPLVAKPGSTYAYVNFNFLLAAMVVEKVSGTTYETFLKTRFFQPLGMKDTGTHLPPADATRAAVGYYDDGGQLVSFADDPIFKDRDLSLSFGSGQIYSTVLDLARWDRALVGVAALPAATRDLLFKPNLEDYGYGWVVENKSGVAYQWHNGALSPLGFTSLMVRVPAKDRFVAYLANRDLKLIQPLFEAKVIALALK